MGVDVLHARTMEFLLQQPPHRIEFDTRHVFVTRSGTWDVAEFETALALAAGVLDRFPQYLVRQCKEERA